MAYNRLHHKTFVALLKLSGLPRSLVEPIGIKLANLDNNEQDELIVLISEELQKKQNLLQVQTP
jgi:hypothetical protein